MHISEINVYPVKSLAGISMPSAELTFAGFQFDRQWMVVETDGTFMTQRIYPQMALIETAIENGKLKLSSFGMESHLVDSANKQSTRINTEVWGDAVNAVELSPETSEWLSQALDAPCKLVSFPTDETRQCDPKFSNQGEHTKFADGFPVLLISQESLDNLNRRLKETVGMDRFRPNLVVSGCEPHAEEKWEKIRVNNVDLRFVKPCERCSVPTVNPQTGVLDGPEPIHTLSSYRQRNGKVFFGMNLIPENEGKISVGDEINLVT